jgi:pilus assembly protein CpaE
METNNQDRSAVECIAFVSDNQTHGVVSNVLEEQFNDPVVRDGSTAQVIEYLSEESPPGILIVDLSDSASPLTAIMSLTAALTEETRIIGIGSVNDITLYREIVDAGATDYVVKPVTEKALTLALQRVNEPTAGATAPQDQDRKQERIAVIGARGGVGVSTVATNIAWYFSQELNNKTVLVDLDLEFGTVALSLDLEPTRGMATEETLAEDLHFNPNAVDILFETIGRSADAIVIDVPRSAFSIRQKALEAASKIVVVTEVTLSGLRDCIRILASAEDAAPQTPIFVVANRAGSQGQAMPISEFQKAIGRKIDFQVPEDSKALNAAANNGKPLLQQDRRGKASKAVEKIAAQLGDVKKKAKKEKAKKPALGALFKRK